MTGTPVRRTLGAVAAFILLGAGTSAAQQAPAPDYKSGAVFYEMFYEHYADAADADLLRRDRINLEPLGTESIAGFDWLHHERADESWWQRVENFVYLLPMIRSDEERDRQWLRRWFDGWYEVHVLEPKPNPGAWDPMTAAIRAMVLIYWMKVEEARGADDIYVRNLGRMIERHQRFLQKEENFESINNHGMWQSLALFETVRVYPSVDIAQVALDRLLTLVKTAVSQQGIEKEHSPSYHFYFLEWLEQYVAYLDSLKLDWGQGVRDMRIVEERMRSGAYFLCDHRNRLPQIGDTDGRTLEGDALALVTPQERDFLYDPEGGMAVFKDAPDSSHKRYVVFCNQNEEFRPLFRHHYHNDMMAVYYSDDGEVILGDGGRLSYSRTQMRAYLMSLVAHNTILPQALIIPQTPGIFVAKEVWAADAPDSVVFGAALIDKVVQREVVVPRGGGGVKIKDSINNPDVFLMLWRLGPDVTGHKQGKVVKYAQWRKYEWELRTARKRKFKLTIRIEGRNGMASEEMAVVEGEEDPYLAWHSPGYDKLDPSPTIKLLLNPRSAEEPLHITTEIVRMD